jgi:protein SCO1/2
VRLVAAVAALVLAAGCGVQDDRPAGTATVTEVDADEFRGTLVDPPLTPAPVTLRDTSGNRVRLDRLDRLEEVSPGGVTAVFFGFTNCHDICPTTMADLAAARRSLPAATAADVNLVFVTVDPQRDTPPVLRRWLDQFDPDIVGLRGPVERVHDAEDSLYASQSGKSAPTSVPDDAGTEREHEPAEEGHTHPDGDPGGYGVDHSSVVYLFGPDGTTVIYTGGATPLDYAADLTRLLND